MAALAPFGHKQIGAKTKVTRRKPARIGNLGDQHVLHNGLLEPQPDLHPDRHLAIEQTAQQDNDDGSMGKDIAQPIETSFFRSEEHTSELQSLMRISYAVFCLK